MGPLNEQALTKLGELAAKDADNLLPHLPVITEANLPIGRTYRESIVLGDASGTQMLIPANAKRLGFLISSLSSTITMSLSSPVIQGAGVNLNIQGTVFTMLKKDFGRLVAMQWFAFLTPGTTNYVLEILP